MSLCNINWKETLSGETHPRPDVDFTVHGEDGQRVFPAHRYLMAIVSPVFKEQFYGANTENVGNDIEEGSGEGGRVKICLDTTYNAAEAFFKYIYEKCFVNLSFNDLFELLKLSERFEMEKLASDVKELIVKFIVDKKEEVVEEISVMKKVEKDNTDKLCIMKITEKDLHDKLAQMDKDKKSLEHTGQQCKKKLEERNEELKQVLARKTSLELVEVKLKRDIDVLKEDQKKLSEENKKLSIMKITEKDLHDKLGQMQKKLEERNKELKQVIEELVEVKLVEIKLKRDIDVLKEDQKKLSEENKKLKHDMKTLGKERATLIENNEVLVKENKTLISQRCLYLVEKKRITEQCNSFSVSNGRIMKENDEMKVKLEKMEENAKMNRITKYIESIHDNIDNANEKEPTDNMQVGDSFIAQWIQDGLLSRGVIDDICSNEKVVVKFLNFGNWDQVPTDGYLSKSSNNQTEKVGEELTDNMKLGCDTSASDPLEVKKETNFESKESNTECSNTAGGRTRLSIPTAEHYQQIEKRANVLESKNKILQLEIKLVKEKASTDKENFKRALTNSNTRHKNIMDDKKQLEEEMEAMKVAYGTQIDFLKKEIGSLKVHHATEDSGHNAAEIPPKDSEIKDSSKVNQDDTKELKQPKEDLEDKNEHVNMLNNKVILLKNELKKIHEELTDVKETLTCKQKELEQLKKDFEEKNEQLNMVKNNVVKESILIEKEKAALYATIKSLNGENAKLKSSPCPMSPRHSSSIKLNSSTSTSGSPLSKKPRLSFSPSDDDEESEDLRMSLDQRKMRRVLVNNADHLDNYVTIEIETGSEEANDGVKIEDGEYVENASGRYVKNPQRRVPSPLEKTQSAGSRKLSPDSHHTPILGRRAHQTPSPGRLGPRNLSPGRLGPRTSSPGRRGPRTPSPRRRGPQTPSPRRRGPRTPSLPPPRTPSPRRLGPRTPSPGRRGLRTPSPRKHGPQTPPLMTIPRNREPRKASSRNRKYKPRRKSPSPRRRPHSPSRRSSPKKPNNTMKPERKDMTKIQVTVPNQRERIQISPDAVNSNDKKRRSFSPGRGKPIEQERDENVDEGKSRKISVKERMEMITMETEKLRRRRQLKERKTGLAEEKKDKSLEEECSTKPLLGSVFQRLGS